MSMLVEKDKSHCWHPFTQHKTEQDHVIIKSANGACLYDENDNEIIDMISSWWTCTHGHSHPELNKALSDQASLMPHIMFSGFSHSGAINLSEKISNILPGNLNKVFFSDNGSTAIEVSLKMAYQYWRNKGEEQRKTFIAFDGAYHGDTFGAMSVGKGSKFFELFEELMMSVELAPYPDTWENDKDVQSKEENAISAFKDIIQDKGNQIAAMIIEPLIQGAGGMRFCRPEFVSEIVKIAKDNNIIVIFDEVAVGFGRTGHLFACQKIGCTPDIICMAKGLTAGYLPMSLTVATDEIYNAFLGDDFNNAFIHGHSFTANPLACAVALRSLELFEEENTLEKIANIGKMHKEQLPRLLDHPMIIHPRVIGSILAFDIIGENNYKSGNSERLRRWFLDNGLNIRPLGSTIYLMPPYCITNKQLETAYNKIYKALEIL